jgi:spore maturation protein CgeB
MNIAFFGSSLVSAYWNGAATYYRGIVRGLHACGHRITFFEPDAYGRQEHRDIDDPPWAEVVVYPGEGEAGVQQALDRARAADVIVKASGVGVFDALLEAAVLDVKRPEALAIFWDVDAPATLDRVQQDPGDPFRPLIPRYDAVFTYGGGDPVVQAYTALGARACVPIYNALDPATHHPVAPDARFAADLGFLGNRLPDREARVEAFFLQVAAKRPERRFLLGGSGWHDKPMPPNVRYAGHVFTRDHNAFNATPLPCSTSTATAWRATGSRRRRASSRRPAPPRASSPTPGRASSSSSNPAAKCSSRATARTWPGTSIGSRLHRRGRSASARSPACWRSTPTRIAPRRSPPCSTRGARRPWPDMHGSLSIVVLGLSITSSWGNGHATTYRALVRELTARGHRVLFLERDQPWYAGNRDMPHPPHGRTVVYQSLEELQDGFAGEVAAADAVIVGSYVPDGIAVGDWVQALATGATAFYDIDTPVTLAALERGECSYIAPRQVSGYHVYLSFSGGPTLDRLERSFGSPAARPLYCSFDPQLYYPESRPEQWDLGYIGTYSDDRQPTLDRLLVEPARRWPEGRFIVAGPQYPEHLAVADQRDARNAHRTQAPPGLLHGAALHAERHARRHGAGGLVAERAPLRGRGVRRADHQRRVARARDLLRSGPRHPRERLHRRDAAAAARAAGRRAPGDRRPRADPRDHHPHGRAPRRRARRLPARGTECRMQNAECRMIPDSAVLPRSAFRTHP